MHTTGRCPWDDSLVFLIASLTSKSISSKNNKSSLLQPSWRPRTPRCKWEFEAAWPIAPLRRPLKPIYKFMTKPKISSTWNFGNREGGGFSAFHTMLPARAVKPNLLQSSRSCGSMGMRGTTIIVMDPVQNRSQSTSEIYRHLEVKGVQEQHRQSFAEARRKSAHNVGGIIGASCTLHDVHLKKVFKKNYTF